MIGNKIISTERKGIKAKQLGGSLPELNIITIQNQIEGLDKRPYNLSSLKGFNLQLGNIFVITQLYNVPM